VATGLKITASIRAIKYKPLLCRQLPVVGDDELEKALSQHSSFLLKSADEANLAISWWVSPKRTRSYPYARVYDTLGFVGKKVTVIPAIKDEGKDGDRDFLQWDTVSLMSLLGVYVIIGYYTDAKSSALYKHKITSQRFSMPEIRQKIGELLSYQSDALHWNMSQVEHVGEIAAKALEAYKRISQTLCVEMHGNVTALKRIQELLKGKNEFMSLSRGLAEKAQKRESVTKQPKERLTGTKATLTIKNYLGGYYFFTADEAWIQGKNLYLAEGKHARGAKLPSLGDIKDGLLKMMLFTNLERVTVEEHTYNPIAVLKLTTGPGFTKYQLGDNQAKLLDLLRQEAKTNQFRILLNNEFVT